MDINFGANTIFGNLAFTIITFTTVNHLVSMQPAPTARVIKRISNHLENQKVVVTFSSEKLHTITVEAKKDFLLSTMGQLRENDTYESIARYKGLPINLFNGRMYISTLLGVATIIGAGETTVLEFNPYSGKSTFFDRKAKRLRIIIDNTGYVSLHGEHEKTVKTP